jgi:hypothetical protein
MASLITSLGCGKELLLILENNRIYWGIKFLINLLELIYTTISLILYFQVKAITKYYYLPTLKSMKVLENMTH